MQVQRKLVVHGFVQGVSYRKQTQRVARHLGITGWVRNLANGDVEAVAEGDEQAVDALVAWCAFGPRRGKVDEVRVSDLPAGGKYADFTIRDGAA